MSKFTLYTDKNSDYRWKFLANNDQVVARSSEAFRNKEDCLKSLALVQSDIGGATVDAVVQGMPVKFGAKVVDNLKPISMGAPAAGPVAAVSATPAVSPVTVTPAVSASPIAAASSVASSPIAISSK